MMMMMCRLKHTHTPDVDVTRQFIDEHAFWNTKRIEAKVISNGFDLVCECVRAFSIDCN